MMSTPLFIHNFYYDVAVARNEAEKNKGKQAKESHAYKSMKSINSQNSGYKKGKKKDFQPDTKCFKKMNLIYNLPTSTERIIGAGSIGLSSLSVSTSPNLRKL